MAERVLVVEDEPDVLDALVQLLAHAGHEARGEADGLAGLRAFQSALGAEPYDLVMLDVMMPKIDGFTLCEAIRSSSDVPVMVLTALDGEDDQLRAFSLLAEHSDHSRTIFDPRQAPAWAPFTFQGLSCQLRRTAHGRFVKARPARPIPASAARTSRNQAVQSSRRRKRTRDRAGASRGKIGGTMAHATKCAAPEDNRGRDEWMTVIEMQEYMRASRNKAYDLIWSGEIDSYRLGRKLLVSRASVDAYIESRSGRR